MPLNDIVDEIVTILGTVTGIGLVRGYEEVVQQHNDFTAAFMTGGIINTVEVVRQTSFETRFTGRRSDDLHTIAINVYRGVAIGDAATTRAAHVTLVEAIRTIFRYNFRLNTEACQLLPAQVAEDGHVEKFGTLMHYSLVTIDVKEDLQAP